MNIMLLAQSDSDFGVVQVFWSMLWFFLFVVWISLVLRVFSDIMRARDLSGVAKALWAIAIIVVPFLGVLIYLVVHGDNMSHRNEQRARDFDEASRSYVQDVVGSGPTAGEQLGTLADLHSSGALNDDEYERAKANLLAS
jgi:hypothetical protein